MLDCTKAMRPGLPRIGTIGEHFTLPRPVHMPTAIGAVAGGVFGLVGALLFGRYLIDTATAIIGMSFVGGVGGIMLVQWRPWKGEHAGRVLLVQAAARRGTAKAVCGGSARLPVDDRASGQYLCAQCGLAVDPEDGLTPRHDWQARFYEGIRPVPEPLTGPVHYFLGSVPARPVQRRPAGVR